VEIRERHRVPISTAQEMRCIWANMAHANPLLSPDDRSQHPEAFMSPVSLNDIARGCLMYPASSVIVQRLADDQAL
jgi:hypothetical protein